MRRWIVVASVAVAACQEKPAQKAPPTTSPQEVVDEAAKAMKTAGRFLDERKDQLEQRLAKKLTDIDQRMEQLRRRAASESAEQRQRTERTIADLDALKAEAERDLKELKNDTGQLWKELGGAVDKAMNQLEEKLDRALSSR